MGRADRRGHRGRLLPQGCFSRTAQAAKPQVPTGQDLSSRPASFPQGPLPQHRASIAGSISGVRRRHHCTRTGTANATRPTRRATAEARPTVARSMADAGSTAGQGSRGGLFPRHTGPKGLGSPTVKGQHHIFQITSLLLEADPATRPHRQISGATPSPPRPTVPDGLDS